MASAMTVLGAVPTDDLGIVLPHEHVLLNTAFAHGPLPDACFPELWDRPVTMDILGALHRDAVSCRDNMVIDDVDLIADELAHFRAAGGGTVVSATVPGIGRDPTAMVEVSERTGLHVISGTGFYIARTHPPVVGKSSIDKLADLMVRDLTEGMDGTAVRAGMIGEIGTGTPIHPRERKVLRAACRAQVRTGAPMQVHVQWPGDQAARIHAVLQEEGVEPGRVVLLHMDDGVPRDVRLRAADWGYFISVDCFGIERYRDRTFEVLPRDTDRIRWVHELIERGHLDQVLVSHDVWLKMLLKRYGGWGYDHLLANVVPWMARAGITDEQVRRIMVANPARLLACPA